MGARQAKCSHPKWPTMNFIALNRSFGSWEWLIKIFPDFSHGKGEIFALKVWFFWKKWIKSCTRLAQWGIEPRPPGWKSGMLTTILWRLGDEIRYEIKSIIQCYDILAMKSHFYRIIIEKKVVGQAGNWTRLYCVRGRSHCSKLPKYALSERMGQSPWWAYWIRKDP